MQSICKLIAALALVLPGAHVFATGSSYAVATRCDGCTALQAKNAATSIAYEYQVDPAATALGYAGFIYVYDYTAATITQYGAFLSQKQGGYTGMLVGPAPANIANAFHTEVSAIKGNGGNLVFTFNVPYPNSIPHTDDSIYDLVQTSAWINSISDYMIANAAANAWSGVTAITTVVLAGQQITYHVIIHTWDGSEVTLSFTAGTGNKFTLDSAEDPNGNDIPLKLADVPGHYDFGFNGSGPSFLGYVESRFGYNGIGAQCVNGILACIDGNGVRTCSWTRCF